MHTADPAQLARIVGAAHVVAGGGPAQVRPGSIDEAAAVVALAHEHRWTVQPQGNGTRQAMCQHVGSGADIVLQLARLDRLIEHHPQNLVAAVQCGMPWSSLQQALATAGQRVPLDPPDPPHPPHRSGDARITGGTVGGVLATNAYGPLRLGYGTARDRLIGATIIRHDGKLIHTGGMVVKNVSGYDLGKLHIGSHGTLGIIVRANFKLAPLPAARATVALHVASREAAWRIVSALRMQPVNLVSAVQRDNELRLGLESSSDAALAAQLQLVPVDARA
ncbi:MAG: FAD-binding oxidoreductase, partial [Planctomycetota bacterium]